jgi:replicative DNA helicase
MTDLSAISTGFPSLDKAIDGGFRAGELIVLGGDAGSGTSSLALAFALNASSAGSVFLSGETTSDRVAERALAIESRVALSDIRRLNLRDEDEQAVAAAAQRLRVQSPVVRTLDHTGLGRITQAIAEQPDVKVVVVDGLESLLTAFDARDDQLAFAVLSLKRLAVAARVTVVLVTHLRLLDRDRNDRRPRLSDFGAHGACAIHADMVFGLYREEIYVEDMALRGATELLLLKWRDGSPGYVDLFFVADSLRFEDVLDDGELDTGTLGTGMDDGIVGDALSNAMLHLGFPDETIIGNAALD